MHSPRSDCLLNAGTLILVRGALTLYRSMTHVFICALVLKISCVYYAPGSEVEEMLVLKSDITMSGEIAYPNKFLESLLQTQVVVKLKWENIEFLGTLLSFDERMNIHLGEAHEYVSGETIDGASGDIIIRCNNILYIRPKPDIYPSPSAGQDIGADEEE